MAARVSSRAAISSAALSDVVKMNISGTRYSVASFVAEELGMLTTAEDEDSHVYWIDGAVTLERFLGLKHYQRVNHFPGMGEICRKDCLGRNMQKLKKVNKEEYSFVPQTWVLPSEYGKLSSYMTEMKRRRRNKVFIVKPHNGSMGNGISLTRSLEGISRDDNVIIQEYVDDPFLLDGFKIDLRVYVLVTSCDPLRIFVYKDGLVRLSTQAYKPPSDDNLSQQYMHLTNYSINKHSNTFDNDSSSNKGSKRTIRYFNSWLSRNGYDISEMWARIHDIIIKTLLVAHPYVVHSYNACRPGSKVEDKSLCFEILGFDILLDKDLKPWLLEVNRSPSFSTDADLDLQIKSGVIKDGLKIVNIRSSDCKKQVSIQKAASRRRLLHMPSKPSRYDFIGEQEEAAYDKEKKKREVKERLLQIRRQREQQDHEEDNMGDYTRIYPTRDWARSKLYDVLLQSASKVSILARQGRASSRSSVSREVQRLEEHELLELLSQYEEEERGQGAECSTQLLPQHQHIRPSTSTPISYQPLSMVDSSTPRDTIYTVMAARVAEEEQVQRTMIALNDMKPFYPGRQSEEVCSVVDRITSDMKRHKPEIASFWLIKLDSVKRKELLNPMKEAIKGLIHCYWRKTTLDSVRLYRILNRLVAFFVSQSGQGLWCTFAPLGKSWEVSFKEWLSEVISITEMACCKRVAQLCQSLVIAGYHYHFVVSPQNNKSRRLSSSVPKCPSLPSVRQSQRPNLTSRRSCSVLLATPHYKPPSTSLYKHRSVPRLY